MSKQTAAMTDRLGCCDKIIRLYDKTVRLFLFDAYRQLEEDKIADQISIKEFIDPFTGSKNPKV